MKVTIETTTTKEIELPKYFKKKYRYYMLKDNMSCIKVSDYGYLPNLGLFPSIEIDDIKNMMNQIEGFEPISESEFKSVFVRVSVLIEEIFSN